jgi:MerR family redox-sensitive transcriptional activator SoxR
MEMMSIGEVAAKVGMQPSAIRYYESLGLVEAPVRAGGKRRYSADVIVRLNALNLFKQAGFTIAELQVLLSSEPWPDRSRIEALTSTKLRELEIMADKIKVMKELLESLRRCGCLRVEECALLLGL